jgi:serine protease AprX
LHKLAKFYMKKSLLFLFFFISGIVQSQEDAWIYFTDKPNAAFYLDNPLEMLSQRAIDRRLNQNIPLDIKDVPIDQGYIDLVSSSQGITVMAQSKWLNCVHVRGEIQDIQELALLSCVSQIRFANRALNSRQQYIAVNQNDNKILDTQITYNYGNSFTQINMHNGQLLHEENYTGTGKIIAILDSGFPNVNVVSPFFRIINNGQILGGYNFIERNDNYFSRGSHGTLVLSTIAGFVETQLIGTAPDANFYLFITEDDTSENPVEESYWVEAAEMADYYGVDVINTSLGYFGYENSAYSYSYQDMDGTTAFISKGLEIAFSRGMICVTSAGNSGNSSSPNISAPADAEHSLTVGSVRSDLSLSSFSSIGPSFDGRIKPDVMALGSSATVAGTNGLVGVASGTSFSSPIIAGLVTCLWQAIPWATNQQILDFVKQSSDRYLNPNNQFGYGIPDFNLALLNTSLATLNSSTPFLVYPNPMENSFYISFPNNINTATIECYTVLGQKILKKEIFSTTEISSNNWQKGVYYYTIKGTNYFQKGILIKK